MDKYDHKKVEKKWQRVWEKEGIYSTPQEGKKRYVLDMFPYPSGSSMHVGHLEGYVGTDILSRYLRMQGFSVLHPMGWDAFGLPAENYAIKTGIHPDKSIPDNIKTFKRQLVTSGMSYDWSREIDTSSPEFYKWTQWIFIQLFKAGLAYKKNSPVNWCPKDETVLANEQVVDGKCERCDTEVIQKDMDQWFFKITAYADRLISGLDKIDWPEEVKRQQINWIGKSEGMIIDFKKEDGTILPVFTTRPDTLNAVTFIAATDEKLWNEGQKEKLGEDTGELAINPLNSQKVPIWKTNYVAPGYGTGNVMGVPAHDERDREFAEKYHLDIVEKEPDEAIAKTAEKEGWGKKHTNFHLRDWLVSRQRYWGAPIPMIYCEHCSSQGESFGAVAGWFPVEEKDLPVVLPTDVDFLPHGESPIARSKTFQKDVVCPSCGKPAKREVDTMDTYVDSSWYFMRFCDPKNNKEFASKERIIPVDDYVGGGHVVQHLLFARFFWKFLFDQGLIDKSVGDEPFLKLRAPGWILGSDSRKMSKRWGNVVTPDDIIPKFGADTLRVYEMFMGPFDVMKPWSVTGVEGAGRFLGRVWRLFTSSRSEAMGSHGDSIGLCPPELLSKLHQTIKKVGEDIQEYKFNTAISALMELVNVFTVHSSQLTVHELKALALLLAPFAPHMMEEVWVTHLHMPFSIHKASWPSYDPKLVVEDEAVIVVQINGKVRATLNLEAGISNQESEVVKFAKSDSNVAKWLEGKEIKKTIFVPGRVINFVIS